MDHSRRNRPAKLPPSRDSRGRGKRSGGRSAAWFDALRTSGYAAGRELVSPAGGDARGSPLGGHLDVGDLGVDGAAQDLALKSVDVDGVHAQRGSDGAELGVQHVGVRSAHAESVDLAARHTPSGLGAAAHATDATLHQTDVSGASASAGRDGVDVQADHISWLNTGAATAGARVDSTTSGHSAQVDAAGLQVHKADVRDASLHADRSGVQVAAGDTRFTNVAAAQASAQVNGPNSHTGIAASDVGVHDTRVQNAELQADRSGLHVGAEDVAFTNLRADKVRAEHSNAAGQGHAQATDLSVHDTHVRGGTFDATRAGLDTHADSVDFMNTRAQNLEAAAQTRGGSQIQAGADALAVHQLGVRDADVHLGRRGIEASAKSVDWQNTAIDNAHASWSGANGAEGHAQADAVAAHKLGVTDGRFALNGQGLSASGGVDYTHAQVDGLDIAHRTAGGTELAAGAQSATVGAVSADHVALQTNLLTGSAHVQGGRVVEHDLIGAHASVGRDGKAALGAKGDLHASHSVEDAKAAWDLGAGEASASVSGYQHDRSVKNATITVLGEELDVPDIAVHLEADAEAALDLGDGELELGIDLSGSSIKVGDFEVTLPEQAQLGVDLDLSEGQLNLNIGGHEVDVDETIGRFWGRLKGLFSGGKAEKASRQEIEQGRENLRALGRGMPRLQRDVRNAVELAKHRRAV